MDDCTRLLTEIENKQQEKIDNHDHLRFQISDLEEKLRT